MTRALIVGGGITGLATAMVLSQQGIEVDLVERQAQVGALGSGITMIGAGIRALDRLGLYQECLENGYGVTDVEFCEVDGTLAARFPLPSPAGVGRPGMLGMMRPALHRILLDHALKEGASIRTATSPVRIEQRPARATVTFSTDEQRDYDLVVGSDGLRSTVRDLALGTTRPEYQGLRAFRVVLPRPAEVTAHRTFRNCGDVAVGFMPIAPDQMYMYGVFSAGEDYRPARGEMVSLIKAKVQPYGGTVAAIREEIREPGQIHLTRLENVLVPDPWYRGCVIVIGDAAHCLTPQLAAGAAIGLEDAIALGRNWPPRLRSMRPCRPSAGAASIDAGTWSRPRLRSVTGRPTQAPPAQISRGQSQRDTRTSLSPSDRLALPAQCFGRILALSEGPASPVPSAVAGPRSGGLGVVEVILGARGRPFVGREAELAVARQALEALPRGAGGVQLVAGESGIGKSRFADEVAAEAEATGVQALRVQCPPVDGRPAYWPWSELLRQLLSGAEGPSWALPADDVLAQVERPTVQQSIDARTRFFQGVRTRLEQAAGSAGLLVVLDDLHWADEPSLQLLSYLSATVSASPLLFLATYRPDEAQHSHPMRRALPLLTRQPGMSRIVLQGLRPADVEHYARAVLGPAFDHRQGQSLYQRTGGHPFFVTELVETMRGGGQDRVPESIREMLNENLDHVPGRALETLRAGAVIGQEFGLAILQAVTNQRAEDLASDLAAAIDRRLLVRTTQPPGRFAFRHLLIREVLYEGMPALDRMRLHRRAAVALEREPALDERLGELARHWLEAATPDALVRGAAFAQRAAESAMAGLGYEEAARLYELALGADPQPAERCRLLLGLATARFRLGEIRHSVASCKQAAGVARQIRRPDLLAEAALVVHHVGDRDANTFLADVCEEALTALAAGTTSLRARLTAQRAAVLSLLGRRPSSDLRAMAAEAMKLAGEGDDPEAVFSALDARQRLLAGVAGDEERVGLGARAVNLATASGRRSYAVSGRMWRIEAWLKLGQTRHVDADLREVVSAGATLRQPLVDWQVLTIRATLAELAGRLADAEVLIRQAQATGCPAEDGGIDCYFHGFMSGLGRLRGGFAEREASLWELIRERPAEPPYGEAFIATAYLDLGREAEARALYEQTTARLDALTPDTRPLSLLAYLSELACAFDDRDRAAPLYRALLPYSRSHLVPSYGTFACEGTISRFLGMLAGCLGQLDTAEAHLRQALEDNGRAGALPFVAMSRLEYARLLRRRGRARDVRAAAALARQAGESAAAMGMPPLRRRAEAFIRELEAGSPAVLTPREAEISRLVAGGLANREVARQLGISVRTVESHVDHILTKLGLSSRAQLRPDP